MRSLKIESFKRSYADKFFAELQLFFLVNFRNYVVFNNLTLSCITLVEDSEPIYWDNRNKTNQKCFHSNMKHFYSRCSCMKDMIHRNNNYHHENFFSVAVIKHYRNQGQSPWKREEGTWPQHFEKIPLT